MQLEIIPKASIDPISTNINAREIACQCDDQFCTHTIYSPELLHRFELLRYDMGSKPLTITSGFRCWNHNQLVSGLDTSFHLVGTAMDILCPDWINYDEFYKRCWSQFDVCISYKRQKFVHCHLDWRGSKKEFKK